MYEVWCIVGKPRFKAICESVITSERERSGIGTLGEKTLHAVLKQYFGPEGAARETRIGPFIADIVTDDCIIEIQTRAFNMLRRKLSAFLEKTPVMVVYPIPKTKWLLWIDGETGGVSKKRKSPKQGAIYDAIPELYKIKPMLNHPNFRLCLALIDMEEYRYLNGWSDDRKKGSTRYDLVPVDMIEEIYISNATDYIKFLPAGLNAQFTSKDYKNAAHTSLHISQTALNILTSVGVVNRVGKLGHLYLYERANPVSGVFAGLVNTAASRI